MSYYLVGGPTQDMNSLHVKLLTDGDPIEFDILVNVTEQDLEGIIKNWIPRTNNYTRKSLVGYINSKSQYGYKAK